MISARLLTALTSFTLLAACSFDPGQTISDIDSAVGVSSAFGSSSVTMSGLVVGDEPFAVKAGATVLAEGGNAADAATAMYFALAVTYPVAAGLGGGGLCIAHDSKSGVTREFDFLARDANGGGAFAVPGSVRGFEALQSSFGKLSWRRVVAPAEGLAAAGFPVSRALSLRLNAAKDTIRQDADLSAQFMNDSGDIKSAGEIVYNRSLAETLGIIRLGGANAFYGGTTGATIAAAQGGAITAADLSGYRVALTSPRTVRLGSQTVLLPNTGIGSGAFAGILIDELSKSVVADGNLESATTTAVKNALQTFGIASLPTDLGSTGFAAQDANGQAVACAVTMNGAFGSGHTVTGTGVTLAAAPKTGVAGTAGAFLTPMISLDGSNALALTGVAAGGPNGTAALAYALFRLANNQVMTGQGAIRSTGVAPYEMVNAIVCQNGACAALPDPGGSGVGVSADSVN